MRVATALLVIATIAGCASSPLELRVTPSYLALQEYGYLEVQTEIINTSSDTVRGVIVYDDATVGNDVARLYDPASAQPVRYHNGKSPEVQPREIAPTDTVKVLVTVAGFGDRVSKASAEKALTPGIYTLEYRVQRFDQNEQKVVSDKAEVTFPVLSTGDADTRIVRSLGSIKDAALRRKDMRRYVEMFIDALSDSTVSDAVLYRLFDALKGFAGIEMESATADHIVIGILEKPFSRKWCDVVQSIAIRSESEMPFASALREYSSTVKDPQKNKYLKALIHKYLTE